MLTLKERALKLRRQGRSYRTIVKMIGVPKATLAGWLKDYQWSNAITRKLTKLQNQNARIRMIAITDKARERRRTLYQNYRDQARLNFKKHFKDQIFIAGLMLYWGEGDNKLSNGKIRISNSDPMILKFFHQFLYTYLPKIYSKIKIFLVLYPDLEDLQSRRYWSEKVGIPLDRFMKSQYIQGRSTKRTLPYGTAQIYVCSTVYKHQLLEWIEQARQYIQRAGIV
ncbi:MAG: hypothetical protein HY606_00475 [Planctomycetes bacterium]|nr:hypothetical protein [Planctomycetota bacterium]